MQVSFAGVDMEFEVAADDGRQEDGVSLFVQLADEVDGVDLVRQRMIEENRVWILLFSDYVMQ